MIKASNCYSDLGYPTIIHPFTCQSSFFNLFSNCLVGISSGINYPNLNFYSINLHFFPFFCIFDNIRSLTLIFTNPNFFHINSAYVDLPLPGGPIIIALTGFLGALFLIFIFKTLIIY